MNLNKTDIEYCRKINKKFGKTYYYATRFFEKEKRNATYVLYAFYRLPDEIVDTETENQAEKLREFITDWKQAVKNGQSDNPVFRATLEVHKHFEIPFEYSLDFLKSMEMDLTKKRYSDYEDLSDYIYGSATCVGLMMSYVVGFDKKMLSTVEKQADNMATAMQLTNMLRDFGEDYFTRDRIYLPQNELVEFEITENQIKNEVIDENFINFMKFEIEKTRKLFKESESEGVPLLNKKGRLAVLLASKIYSEILTEIEKNNYDVFTKRARVSIWRKIVITFDIIFKYGK